MGAKVKKLKISNKILVNSSNTKNSFIQMYEQENTGKKYIKISIEVKNKRLKCAAFSMSVLRFRENSERQLPEVKCSVVHCLVVSSVSQ